MLNLTPSAVSHAIRKLEQVLGIPSSSATPATFA